MQLIGQIYRNLMCIIRSMVHVLQLDQMVVMIDRPNYNPANTDDGSCMCRWYCTDPNYFGDTLFISSGNYICLYHHQHLP